MRTIYKRKDIGNRIINTILRIEKRARLVEAAEKESNFITYQ